MHCHQNARVQGPGWAESCTMYLVPAQGGRLFCLWVAGRPFINRPGLSNTCRYLRRSPSRQIQTPCPLRTSQWGAHFCMSFVSPILLTSHWSSVLHVRPELIVGSPWIHPLGEFQRNSLKSSCQLSIFSTFSLFQIHFNGSIRVLSH